MYGNTGYIGSSRSVRSAQSIELFVVPLSMINKTLIAEFLKQDFVRTAFSSDQISFLEQKTIKEWKCAAKFEGSSSWHHTGKYFNKTEHYDLETLACSLIENEDEIKNILKTEKAEKTESKEYKYGYIQVTEWGGSRKHPKIIGHPVYAGIVFGQWLYYLNNGTVAKLKTNANKVEDFASYEKYTDLTKAHPEFKNTKKSFNQILKEIKL